MKKITLLFTFVLFISISTIKTFASTAYEKDLHNWLDSTLVSEQIDWNKTEAEFFVFAKELCNKDQSIEVILRRIFDKSSKSKKEFLTPKGDYKHLKKLSLITTSTFKKLEATSFDFVKRHKQWENYNSATRLSLFFMYVNYWKLDVFKPKDISRKLIQLNYYVANKELSKKIIILTLVQKVLLQNAYVKQIELKKHTIL